MTVLNRPNKQNPWLTCFTPNPTATLRLFCFPYAGGSAPAFREWSTLLPNAEIIALQYPGRGARMMEPPKQSLPEVAEGVYEAILPYLNKPFAFFGHSLGTLVAFEVTRLLRKNGHPLPQHLFISARKAPHMPRGADRLMHNLPENEFIEELKHYNGTPKEILENKDLMELVLPVLRADFRVNETYEYREEPALNIPLTAFTGLEDPRATVEDMAQWSLHTSSAFTHQTFQGDHFYLNPLQQELIASIAKHLNL